MKCLLPTAHSVPSGKVIALPIQASWRLVRTLIAEISASRCNSANLDGVSERYNVHSSEEDDDDDEPILPSKLSQLKGVFPTLKSLLDMENNMCKNLLEESPKRKKGQSPLVEADCTDCIPLQEGGAIEALGEAASCPEQYFCKVCERELGNAYIRCKGCNDSGGILPYAYNVCCFCYKKEKNQVSVGHLRHAQIRGQLGFACAKCKSYRKSLCKELVSSAQCYACYKGCVICACSCHTVYEVRYRFVCPNDLASLVTKYEAIVSNGPS